MSTAILVGPGRAGLSLGLAMAAAHHTFLGVVARDAAAAESAAGRLATEAIPLGADLPQCDLLILAVADDAITDLALTLAPVAKQVAAAVHMSGIADLDRLDPLAAVGLAVGSFHPLQTLPDPDAGAARLAGAWVAIDAANDDLRRDLTALAESIGATSFDVDPEARALYHAAAAAAANFPLAALAMAEDLFAAAGVPFEAARPLVTTVIDNAFSMGPRPALTGPVARGDAGTVSAQLEAVGRFAPEWDQAFRSFVAVLADMTDQSIDVT